MTSFDSSTGGVLLPDTATAPAEDLELDALFQVTVAGITQLDGLLVRPRWQPITPKQPEPGTNWCALGVIDSEPDAGPSIVHNSDNLGSDNYIRHESLSLLTSFYGPNAKSLAGQLRDGIAIPQNMEVLKAAQIAFVACGRAIATAELVNQQWVRRVDMTLRFRRKVSRVYGIRNIIAADVHLFDDTHVDDLIHVPLAP